MFGPREVLLTSDVPAVEQFLNGRKEGPIGMSEEKDAAVVAAELASLENGAAPVNGAVVSGVPAQLQPSPGLPERRAVARRHQRVLDMLHTLPPKAQDAVRKLMDEEERQAREYADTLRANQLAMESTGPALPGPVVGANPPAPA
jgi:phospholipid/cholesterol/gamma-HCH transport system ATP-binding protein